MLFAQLAVENTTYRFDKPFTYTVPEALAGAVRPGVRVTVPFGAGNRTRVGMVLSVSEAPAADGRLKAVLSVLDRAPLLSDEMLQLVPWMKSRYYCTLFEAVKLMIPAGIGYKIVNRYRISAAFKDYDRTAYGDLAWQIIMLLSDAKGGMTGAQLSEKLGIDEKSPALRELLEKGIVICENAASRNLNDATARMVCAVPDFSGKLSPKQQSAYDTLCAAGTVTVRELCYYTGVSTAVVKALCEKGAAESFEVERFRRPKVSGKDVALPEALSPEQARVAESIVRECDMPTAAVALLYGITGSGKTAVFMHVIRHVLAQGRGVIVTVPEISLTPQTLAVFTAAFGDTVAVFHSGLSMGERMDEWKRVHSGKARIVVGTRSAVFAPVQNLGLIVMDEEQESTYKSESSPRYHAREIAKFRVHYNNAYCLLCSATPSVESYFMAKSGKYRYHALLNRYGDALVPDVRLVDMNEEDLYRGKPMISMALARAISGNLAQGRQSIVLLNRRGYHTYAVCKNCKTVVTCPNCSISLTYHAANNRLMCHYCGHSEPANVRCAACGSAEITFSGGGTQKAEDQLREAFPEARILRIDTDTTANKYALEKKLAAFSAGEYDIMVGTQMVAKGLDFENVTLVGVLSADQSLYSDDYRSNERTFDLLTQVVGRAGRGRYRGTALIQTHVPENPYLRLAAGQDYERFFETEIRFRRAMLYPPFSDILQIGFVGEKEEQVRQAAECFSARLRETFSRDYPALPLRLLRASAASVSRMGGKYRYKIIMKYKNTRQFRDIIAAQLVDFAADKRFQSVTAYADPNPDTIL